MTDIVNSTGQAGALYLSDLVTGIVAVLVQRRVITLSIRNNRLDRAMARLFEVDLAPEAKRRGIALRFRIRLHELHGDSIAVQRALYEAAQRNLLSFDNYDIRLKICEAEAEAYFEDLPGDPDLYRLLTAKLFQYYREDLP